MNAKNELFVSIITGFVLSILILTGPAKAFLLDLSSDKSNVITGESIVFTASITIADEQIPIEKLILELQGPENISCEFNQDGTIIQGCKGISIKKLLTETSEYGYNYGYYTGYSYDFGYGYGYSTDLKYEITLLTQDYASGQYTTKLILPINSDNFEEQGPAITINPVSTSSYSSSSSTQSKIVSCTSETWECSTWTDCKDSFQTRTCINLNQNCKSFFPPDEIRSCSQGNQENNINSNEQDSENQRDSLAAKGLSRITGAVIGNLNKPSTRIIVLIIIILASLSIIILTRRIITKYKDNHKK